MMQMQCPNCGNILPVGTKYCPQCGTNLVDLQADGSQKPWQPHQPCNQPYAPYGGDGNRNNNTWLYALVGVLVVVVLGGAAYFFINKSNSDKETLELLKKNQEELASKNKELVEQNTKLSENKQDTKIIIREGAVHAAEHRAVSAGGSAGGAKVVINGTGVRLRFAPDLNAGYLTWANGATRAPKKGARLEYIGEDSDWYEVRYLGQTFYVSKEYSYLEY